MHVALALLRVLRVGEGEAVLHVEAATRVEAVCEPLVAVVFAAVVVIGRRVPAAQAERCVCVSEREGHGVVPQQSGVCQVPRRAERERERVLRAYCISISPNP